MNAESFLKEELRKIDFEVSRENVYFTFDAFSLSELLSFAATEQVFFFESKDTDYSFLGLGVSKHLDFHEVQAFITENAQDTLAYQDYFEQDTPVKCFLPEWCFVKKGKTITLRINKSIEYQSYSPSNIIFNLPVWESFIAPWISYEEKPESDEWKSMIDESNRLLKKNELEKIVLARKKVFTYDSPIEMLVFFRELYLANLDSSHFSIYHQFNYGEAFISFTPERLITLNNLQFETISLAGSMPRSENHQEDLALEKELQTSDKINREHNIVTTSIKERLAPFLKSIEISPLMTMKLPYIQHRQAIIKGELIDGTAVTDIISLLHPTPAVGGIPYEKAQQKILEIEKSKRGLYAAPVGVISKVFAEIVVGIRSALIEGSVLSVYGGAGIVLGSVAEDEWIETGSKMRPFIKVINKGLV